MVKRRSYGRGAQKRSFSTAFKSAANLALRFKRARTNTKTATTSSKGSESRPVTTQNDAVVDFRSRRRRGWRRAKRRKRFTRRVARVIQSQYPNNRILHQSVFRLTSSQDATNAACYQLYGGDGARDPNINPCSDLRHMFIESLSGFGFGSHTGTPIDRALEFDQQTDQTSPSSSYNTELSDPRIFFSKGLMESTFRNTGTNDCIVEVYQYITRRTVPSATNVSGTQPGLNTPIDAYAVGFSKMRPVESTATTNTQFSSVIGGPTQTFTTVGTTPFQSALFTKYFKVIKRTRYRLAAGSEASFVHRFSKQFSLRASQVRARSCLAGITNGFIFQIQGCPGVVTGTAHLALPAEVTFTNIRHYNVKYFPGITGTGSLNATSDVYQSV
ncbi:capsid [uncultured virus]|uniref:Capsid n=1 Tax=uncultured virus TaxID=340016 RepID=A0A2K9LRW3_9VIRU|nr:capsid [uncultured virus]